MDEFVSLISPTLLGLSGRVFYSGRSAFTEKGELYVLGFNPGGDPESERETVDRHTSFVLHEAPALWSAYCDESWKGKVPGKHGLQPRVLHLFKRIGRDPRRIPCSNLIFVRSSRAANLSHDNLEELCWPVHQAIIERLRPRVVLCLGNQVGDRVPRRLDANEPIGEFIEANKRKWTSRAHKSPDGRIVLSLTHPSIADWTASPTDPSSLVLRFLAERWFAGPAITTARSSQSAPPSILDLSVGAIGSLRLFLMPMA